MYKRQVIILLRFAHVIFIEINVDKIINSFTKIFFVNVVNVYHICGRRRTRRHLLEAAPRHDHVIKRHKQTSVRLAEKQQQTFNRAFNSLAATAVLVSALSFKFLLSVSLKVGP